MRYIKEYVASYPNISRDENRYWYLKMVEDVANFYYDDNVTFLGSGAFGDIFVFDNHPSKVIKITYEESEIGIVEKMRKLPELKHVMNYYDVRKIKSEKLGSEYWVILMDRIIPLNNHKLKDYPSIYNSYDDFLKIDYRNKIKYNELKNKFENEAKFDNFWNHMKFNKHFKLKKDDIKNFVVQIQEAILELAKYKLLYLTDSHDGNCGFKLNGNFCFYDMMLGDFEPKTKLKPIITRW